VAIAGIAEIVRAHPKWVFLFDIMLDSFCSLETTQVFALTWIAMRNHHPDESYFALLGGDCDFQRQLQIKGASGCKATD
jgi:hypothetical protein